MDLGDRGRGQGALLEATEELVEGLAELLLDGRLDRLEGERVGFVLQGLEGLDVLGGDDVRASAQDLAGLDKGRTQLLEHASHADSSREVPELGADLASLDVDLL